ncbi:MAG: GSCFA domain-containing protein [Flavobacterium sp.]|nr:GSCFA domain-containing protein [Flavobacterium sp.]
MQFRTQIPISKSNHPIGYESKVVSLGSCFAVNIGEKFQYFKFQNTFNPFGILFHPLAIEKFIDFTLSGKEFGASDVFFHNEQWHCFDAHSEISHPEQGALLENLNQITQSTNNQITEATHLIITLGTAWIYRKIDSGAIVANCHKIPQQQFTKELLSSKSIKESLARIIEKVNATNPNCKIIFTVSPVRHIKDGFVENQWSKSNFITAVHETILQFRENAVYFPSYEIMMDELRDYRFYAEDMLHPNQIAINYIWERFSEAYISAESQAVMTEIDSIQKSLLHRPFNVESEQHQQFLSKLRQKIDAILQHYPQVKF